MRFYYAKGMIEIDTIGGSRAVKYAQWCVEETERKRRIMSGF